ncbi:MAG: 4-alpha-glucanotransferase [Prolixibacteraceae bacterium]|nr:4-alpha-glucanotransferase [Prolixibacteraceae bacterium]
METKRKSGILLHISSLPSVHGIGDFGPEAYHFVDQLAENGFSVWQFLPVGPVGPGNSPYQAYSAYAGEPLLISMEVLQKWGLLPEEDLEPPLFDPEKVDYDKVTSWKYPLFQLAWIQFREFSDPAFQHEFKVFMDEHHWWLNDYALYKACKTRFEGEPWNKWEKSLKERQEAAIEQYTILLHDEIHLEKFIQFLFFRQWFQLKQYTNEKGIELFGDLPLYVSHDSADVWGNQGLFVLDEGGEPALMGGVPPDYFSEDGQLWGNPVFNWEELSATNYQWWLTRLYFNLHMFNLVRIDHFRGLESFWAVENGALTAKTGKWMKADGNGMLQILKAQLGHLPVVAEDLGIITPEVEQLRNTFQLPGMKVLQFAFTSDFRNEHLPHNFSGPCVVYTGTHDNNTLKGWLNHLPVEEKKLLSSYVSARGQQLYQRLIEMTWASTASLAMVPMQDVLGLNGHSRMNIPGTATGNWTWRYRKTALKSDRLAFFKRLNTIYNRYNG